MLIFYVCTQWRIDEFRFNFRLSYGDYNRHCIIHNIRGLSNHFYPSEFISEPL